VQTTLLRRTLALRSDPCSQGFFCGVDVSRLTSYVFPHKSRQQLVIGSKKVFRHDANVSDDRHEVRVAYPAGHDMNVKVVVHARSGGLAEIYPDIESLRREIRGENLYGHIHCCKKVEHFIAVQIFRSGNVTVWTNEQMTVAVRIAIHHDERMPGPVKHKKVPVLLFIFAKAENASFRLLIQNVLHPPGSPEPFHYSQPAFIFT
jgi:hypothetical protein